ncbi:hypothetical protein SUGI_0915290 [Cryptomeria japonica]|uniref:protein OVEREXPRESSOR OF CATIONIC PEROXIDASE 3 n=1 Tax=Cryptomeria japonica TaxID=3369 RepID=UPI0024148667|nr:protein OVEREXPRESSOR OF CATIONIC PEROXIDASE 3 [Cryptomeria japonica]GLJ43904.1 hypothetical protein SUGI_0915290 [Cryptomeria japonica]
MTTSSSALPMTISMPMRVPHLQIHPQHVRYMQCKWKCWPLPFNIRRDPLQFRAAASSRRSKDRSFPKPEKLQKDEDDGEDLVDAALESLFSQLEKDLENDTLSDDEEITEEEMAKFEEELRGLSNAEAGDEITEEEMAKFEEELRGLSNAEAADEKALLDYAPLELEDYQLQKLAAALNVGRRKASIKKLTAEVGLERETVLELLRNPPPQLVLFQDREDTEKSIEDTDAVLTTKYNLESSEFQRKPSNSRLPSLAETEVQRNESEYQIIVNQRGWNTRKRLKKVQVATLEKVYQRTRRPTEAMVSNMVQLTKLPRKSILEWFDGKRAQEGTKFAYKKKQQ